MIVSLPNGKCIEMSLEHYLRMSDEDFNDLTAYNAGEDLQDPFHSSVLLYGEANIENDILEEDLLLEEVELPDISDEEKLTDPEFYNQDELEK